MMNEYNDLYIQVCMYVQWTTRSLALTLHFKTYKLCIGYTLHTYTHAREIYYQTNNLPLKIFLYAPVSLFVSIVKKGRGVRDFSNLVFPKFTFLSRVVCTVACRNLTFSNVLFTLVWPHREREKLYSTTLSIGNRFFENSWIVQYFSSGSKRKLLLKVLFIYFRLLV